MAIIAWEGKKRKELRWPRFHYSTTCCRVLLFSWQISIVPKEQCIKCPQSELIFPLCSSKSLLWEAWLTALYKPSSYIILHVTNEKSMAHVCVSTWVYAVLANIHLITLGARTRLNVQFPTRVWKKKKTRSEEIIFPRLICQLQSSI